MLHDDVFFRYLMIVYYHIMLLFLKNEIFPFLVSQKYSTTDTRVIWGVLKCSTYTATIIERNMFKYSIEN